MPPFNATQYFSASFYSQPDALPPPSLTHPLNLISCMLMKEVFFRDWMKTFLSRLISFAIPPIWELATCWKIIIMIMPGQRAGVPFINTVHFSRLLFTVVNFTQTDRQTYTSNDDRDYHVEELCVCEHETEWIRLNLNEWQKSEKFCRILKSSVQRLRARGKKINRKIETEKKRNRKHRLKSHSMYRYIYMYF